MSIPILRIKDKNGNWIPIPAIKGDKGDKGADGTMTFSDLTEEQKASLHGKDGVDGLTPFIGENGNWWIGTTDTGTKASCDIKIATGSYNGASSSTFVLSFDFVPKAIFIEGGTPDSKTWLWEFGFLSPQAGTGIGIAGNGTAGSYDEEVHGLTCAVEGNTVTVTTYGNILNTGSATYHYVAIG